MVSGEKTKGLSRAWRGREMGKGIGVEEEEKRGLSRNVLESCSPHWDVAAVGRESCKPGKSGSGSWLMSSWIHSRKLFPTIGRVQATPAPPLTPRAWSSDLGLTRLGPELLRVSELGRDRLTHCSESSFVSLGPGWRSGGVAFAGRPMS